jgi:hypothetical protein
METWSPFVTCLNPVWRDIFIPIGRSLLSRWVFCSDHNPAMRDIFIPDLSSNYKTVFPWLECLNPARRDILIPPLYLGDITKTSGPSLQSRHAGYCDSLSIGYPIPGGTELDKS